jgi:tetratricopeptide (TPR) repeat protein
MERMTIAGAVNQHHINRKLLTVMRSPWNRNRPIAALLLCLATLSVQAATDWKLVHERTVQAMDHLYNLEFRDAERLCNEVIKMAPGDPRGHFFKAMTYYYRMSFRGGATNDSAFWAFAWHADRVRTVCERLLEKNEHDGKAMFYLGGAVGYKGLAYVNRGESHKAIWDGKKGYDLLEQAVEEDPTNYDAKMGLGLFRHLISKAPDALKPVISLAGLTGDRYGGLKMIEEAAAKGTYARQEARRWLGELYLDEDLPQRAVIHLAALKDAYKKNWYFWYRYADVTAFQVRKINEAEAAYRYLATIETSKEDLETAHFIGYVRLGTLDEARERYTEAIKHYEHAHELATTKERKDQTTSMIAWAKRMAVNESSDEIQIDRITNALGVGLYHRVVVLGRYLEVRTTSTIAVILHGYVLC